MSNVSWSHEALHQVFETDTAMFGRLFAALGMGLSEPESVVRISSDVTEVRPLSRAIDGAFELEVEGVGYAALLEPQRKIDPDKIGMWAYSQSYFYERYGLVPLLMVLCNDPKTAQWADREHGIGPKDRPGLVVHPYVVGPHNMPRITDVEDVVTDPHLAVLAAIVHALDKDLSGILEPLAAGLRRIDPNEAMLLTDFVDIGLADFPALNVWRGIMKIERSMFRGTIVPEFIAEVEAEATAKGMAKGMVEGEAKGKAEGEAKGMAEGKAEGETAAEVRLLLKTLVARSIEVADADRARITSCTDVELLDRWFDRALRATTITEVLDEK